MSEQITYEAFDGESAGPEVVTGAGELSRLAAVPVQVSVELGRASMTIGEALRLAVGSIVALDRLSGEPVDLLVNGKAIGRGEVVVIDEQLGLRLTEIVG